ncbi:MAG TPA: hypothetical protein PK184_16190 [Phycisphaerae bacterium]|nr:hypothetical protein [Phycisphaerae bacterium]HPP22675.1 hypothetical protein [Phycisphaerae bacterium]HPU34236.1 hypothetical protein [Phycisphaerae bacterium]HXK85894.1 hypothetical protein [Phycisphaerae bacterium]
MTRQSRIRRWMRVWGLLVPGAALLSTGTSCGDQIRQSLLDTGTTFVSQSLSLLIESAVTDLLAGADQALPQQ